MAGLDPAIGYPHQIANDAIPVSNHPMEMAGSSLGHDGVGGACSKDPRINNRSKFGIAGVKPSCRAKARHPRLFVVQHCKTWIQGLRPA